MPSSRGIRAGAAYVELYANDSRLARGLKRASRRLKAFGTGVADIGKRLMVASAALATPFIGGAKVFADFEREMANVATMLERPEEHMDRFRAGVRRMAMEFGESTEALAGGLYDILSASIDPARALDVLAASVKAAKAGMTDTKTAADAITTVLNSYGLAADQAGTVSDLLFSVVKRGKTTFGQLAPAVGMVASTAASAGVGLEELGAALATLTRHGVQTENAVTAVNQIIMTFLKPSKEAEETARALGFEMSAATLQAEGLVGVFQRIAALPPDAVAALFPNVRALRGVIPALKNLEGFLGDVELMRGRAGATETAYRKMAGTLAHAFAQVREAGLVALSMIGEALAEPLTRAAAAVKRYAAIAIDLIQRNKAIVVAVAKVVLVLGLAGGALLAVGMAAKVVAGAFAGLAAIVSGAGAVIGLLGSVLAAIVSPVGLVIAAVAALGAYLLYVSGAAGKALKWLGEKFEALKGFALQAWRGIADALAAGDIGLAAKVLWLTLRVAWQKGVAWLKGHWLDWKKAFLDTATDAFYGVLALWAQLKAKLATVWHEPRAMLKTVASVAVGVVKLKLHEVEYKREGEALKKKRARGEISEEEFQAAWQDLYRRTKARHAEIVGETDAALADTDKELQERLTAIEGEKNAALLGVSEKAADARRRHAEEHAADLEQSEADLAKAREEWQAAIAEAAGKRKAREAEDEGPGALEAPPDLAADAQKRLAGVGDALSRAADRIVAVQGTFSAMVAGRIGAGGVAERTARATEETAKNTKRLVDEATMGEGLVFD